MALPEQEITDWTQEFLSNLKQNCYYQEDAAYDYSAMILVWNILGNEFDWKTINRAIIDRWSEAGLVKIKEAAWAAFEKDINGR